MAHRPENAEQRAAFERYFRQGAGRSIERLAAELAQTTRPRSLRALYGWSSRFGWQARIAEIEGGAAAEDDERLRLEHRAMQERHQQLGLALQKAGLERLAALPRELKPADAVRLLQVGISLETGARPRPPEKVDITARIYELALEEGLDPRQAVLDAERLIKDAGL